MISGRGSRRDLVVRQTTLCDAQGRRMEFNGLFTLAPIPKGGFVGLYSGKFCKRFNSRQKPYAVSTSADLFIVPQVSRSMGRKYPLAMINEPQFGTTSNVFGLEWSSAYKVVHNELPKKDSVVCFAFHASQDIDAHEELFWSYGRGYDRSHYDDPRVGQNVRIRQSDVPRDEWPSAYFAQHGEYPPEDCYLLIF